MAIYLSRKKGGTVATPITPSNATPAALTADTPVNPTANGYAIESYSSVTPSNSSPATITSGSIYKASANGKAVASVTDVTPSSTPTSVSANDVVKIGGSGVIVDSIPTPTSLTPSNNTPANIASGQIYIATANGRAIESYDGLTATPTNVSVGDFLHVNVAGKAAMLQTITPSNTNPPEIYTLRGYEPTTPGYVVRSYDSVTPSSTPEAVTAGDMVQINGSGVIVDSIPTPTNLVPSNSSPATITSGETYTAMDSGKAVKTITDITPSASGTSVSTNDIVKIGGSGYVVNPASKTPSDSSPASVSSGAIIKNAGSSTGYLYASSGLKKVKTGSVTLTASSNNTITTGFQPKYICWSIGTGSLSAYNQDISTTQFKKAGSSGISNVNIGTTASYNLMSISSTGFVIRGASSSVTMDYFAVG